MMSIASLSTPRCQRSLTWGYYCVLWCGHRGTPIYFRNQVFASKPMSTGILCVEVGFGWVGIVRFRKYFHYTRSSSTLVAPTTAFSSQSKGCAVGNTYRVYYYHCKYNPATVNTTRPPFPGQGDGGGKHEDFFFVIFYNLNKFSTMSIAFLSRPRCQWSLTRGIYYHWKYNLATVDIT